SGKRAAKSNTERRIIWHSKKFVDVLIRSHRDEKRSLVLESSPGYERPRAISRSGEIALEKVPNYPCPRCGQPQLNVYYSDKADSRVGAWCENCDLKAYYDGEQLIPIG